jgi:hypothetical protein
MGLVNHAAFLRGGGTFAPSRRAFDKPMAIACLRFLCSPRLRWRISVATSFRAFGPYLLRLDRPDDLLRPEDLPDEPPLLEDDRLDDFLAEDFFAADLFAGALRADDFFAAVRPAPERLLLEDFFAAVRPLEPRLDDDLPDDFFALDFFVAILTFSIEVARARARTFNSQSAQTILWVAR